MNTLMRHHHERMLTGSNDRNRTNIRHDSSYTHRKRNKHGAHISNNSNLEPDFYKMTQWRHDPYARQRLNGLSQVRGFSRPEFSHSVHSVRSIPVAVSLAIP